LGIQAIRVPIVAFVLSVSLIAVAFVAVNFAAPRPESSVDVAGTTPIRHVFVIMKENHAFDNYFGTFPGADGIPPNVALSDGRGGSISPHHLTTSWTPDLPHSREAMLQSYNGGRNDGFVLAAETAAHGLGSFAMGYYDRRQIGGYWDLAENYTLADRYFQSMFGPTIPNRLYSFAGHAGGLTTNMIGGSGLDLPTIFDQLETRGISWKYYSSVIPFYPPIPLNFPHIRNNQGMASKVVAMNQLLPDVVRGVSPQVVFVDTEFDPDISEHPVASVTTGEEWTMQIVGAIMASPQWSSTAIFLVWDESGGFYDHVAPPQVDNWGYGFRVPLLLISPFAKRGWIDHTLMDHTSLMRFIADNWNMPYLTDREAQAGSPTNAFVFDHSGSANKFVPLPLAYAQVTNELMEPAPLARDSLLSCQVEDP